MGRRRREGAVSVARAFRAAGGTFVERPAAIARRLEAVRALVFDWDGVFNDGRRAQGGFAEGDSMGLNMLRYGFWRRDGRIPVTAIVSGRDNPGASEFAERERVHALYLGVGDKAEAMRHLCAANGLAAGQASWMFDDVNDLPPARGAGLRILVRRAAGPLFPRHVRSEGLVDYVTAQDGGRGAVREAAELMLGLMGRF